MVVRIYSKPDLDKKIVEDDNITLLSATLLFAITVSYSKSDDIKDEENVLISHLKHSMKDS